MIGGHSGRGRWRGQEGRAFQRRETGKKEADVHGRGKSAEGKPVAMVQGNWQGSSREGWRGKPCRAGGSGSTEKAAGGLPNAIARGKWREHTPRRSAGKAIKECPEGGRAQGNWREGDWELPRRETGKKEGGECGIGKPMGGRSRAAAPENRRSGARKGPCRKIGKRGMRATARENRGRRTGRSGTEKATGTPPRGDGAGTPVSRRRGSETGQKSRATKGERAAAPFGNRPLLSLSRRS